MHRSQIRLIKTANSSGKERCVAVTVVAAPTASFAAGDAVGVDIIVQVSNSKQASSTN